MRLTFVIGALTATAMIIQAGAEKHTLKELLKRVLADPKVYSLVPDNPNDPYRRAREALDAVGSDDEIRTTLTEILSESNESTLWITALRESQARGVPSEVLADWVRQHIAWVSNQNDFSLSEALSVLKTHANPTDAELLRQVAAGLPDSSTRRKDALLFVATDIPFLVKQREDGDVRARELEQKAAAGDRSPEVQLWLDRKKEELAQQEGRKKYRQQLEARHGDSGTFTTHSEPLPKHSAKGLPEQTPLTTEVSPSRPEGTSPTRVAWIAVAVAVIGFFWLALKKKQHS